MGTNPLEVLSMIAHMFGFGDHWSRILRIAHGKRKFEPLYWEDQHKRKIAILHREIRSLVTKGGIIRKEKGAK